MSAPAVAYDVAVLGMTTALGAGVGVGVAALVGLAQHKPAALGTGAAIGGAIGLVSAIL